MSGKHEEIKDWLVSLSHLIQQNADPDPFYLGIFSYRPQLSFNIVDILNELEDDVEKEPSFYSACILGLEICVAQLQVGCENGNKTSHKIMNELMSKLAYAIRQNRHTINFWLPTLNAFYEVHAELSNELRDAYLDSVSEEEEVNEEVDHLEAIKGLIAELGEQSAFVIADNFFAQSYAMPIDFFMDLVFDLYSIPEGQDIALLLLLHPNAEVRQMVIAAHEQIIEEVVFNPISLSRLQVIQSWYGAPYQEQFGRWLKIQRKKGVVFTAAKEASIVSIKASEVDGSGAQGIFIHTRQGRVNRLCGLLIKHGLGIKDAWLTTTMPAKSINQYYKEAFDDTITLKQVDFEYLTLILEHFLAVTLLRKELPSLHFLEIEELIGHHFKPNLIDEKELIARLSVQISPFTAEEMDTALKRTRSWLHKKSFTDSWFIENAHIDKLVNRHSSFVEGAKVCMVGDAMQTLFVEEFEKNRTKWLWHFLWTSLWLKTKATAKNKQWQDSLFIAYVIAEGRPLCEIPVMQEIAKLTITNSIETMHERKTHLH